MSHSKWRAGRSASSRPCACTFYSSCAGFSGKLSHHPGLSAPLQPRCGSSWLMAFPKAKIGVEREVICEYDGHAVHKLSQQCVTAEWLAPCESDCWRMHSTVSCDWLPSYIKATWPVLEIFKMAGYFADSPCTQHTCASHRHIPLTLCHPHNSALSLYTSATHYIIQDHKLHVIKRGFLHSILSQYNIHILSFLKHDIQ